MKSISLRIIPSCLVFVSFLTSCGTEPITGDTPINPVVAVRSDLDAKAYPTDQDGLQSASAIGTTVDSLEVTSAYVMVTGLNFHGIDENGAGQVNRIRTDQTLIVFHPQWPNFVTDAEVAAGTQSRATYEVRPLHGNIDSLARIDVRLRDFVTYGPSNAVIVTGHTFKNGVKVPFVFASVAMFASEFAFKPHLTLTSGDREELRMRFQAQTAFGANGAVMDPNDVLNRAMIETNLQSSIGFFRL